MTRRNTNSFFILPLALCCVLAGPAAAAVVSTASIRTDLDGLDFLSQDRGHADSKYVQDYMYTRSQRRNDIAAPPPVVPDPGLTPVPVAEFTGRTAAPKTTAAAKVPALTTSLDSIISAAKAAMPAAAAPEAAKAKAGKADDRNIFQKIGDWFSDAFKTVTGWISDAFTWVKEGLVGRKRQLTAEEISEMRKIYGDSIDYSKVRVVDGSKQGLWGMILTSGDAAVTWGNTIYFPKGKYSFANNPGWLAHEMAHEYQYQTDGWGYAVKSVWGQITKGKSFYDYELTAGKKFGQYNVEQQADIVEHYYQIKNGTRSATPEERAIYDQMMAEEGLF